MPAPKELLVKFNAYSQALSFDLKNDTLEQVVKKITQLSKRNVVVASGLHDKLVNLYVEDMPFDNAVEKLALLNQLQVIKTADNFYIIRKPGEAEQGLAGAEAKTDPRTAYKKNATNTGKLFIQVKDTMGAKRVNALASGTPLVDIIDAVSQEAGISYFLYSDIKGIITTQINDLPINDFFTRLLQGTDYTFQDDKGIYMIGERRLEGLRANRVFQFQFRSLESAHDVIPAELKKGVEIKEFKELNSLLLTGALPQINEIEAFLRQIDRVVPLVLIEVTLVDIRKGKSVNTGIRAGVSDSVSSGGTLLPGLDFTFSAKSINDFLTRLGVNNTLSLGRVTPNFYLGLSALEQNNNIEVRSMPKLSTLNGHDAQLSIGSTRYYSIRTQNVVGTLTPQTVVTEQFNAVQANLAINIKPFVSGDDQVTLTIDVSISDFIGDPPNNAPPPSANSQFKSIVRVRNEEMIVLGGLERTEKSENGSGIPVLSRIPVLKWLFSNRTRSTNKVVSVVFIKPTIIY